MNMIGISPLSALLALSLIGCDAEPSRSAPDDRAANVEKTMQIAEPEIAEKELIVLAAPRSRDPYYADLKETIIEFQIRYAQRIAKHDRVLILTDTEQAPHFAKALSGNQTIIAPMDDIWMRDFGLPNPQMPIKFRYTAAGQGGGHKGQRDADFVQQRLIRTILPAQLIFSRSDLYNDGGNFVEDGAGRAVISRKFLRDNALSEAAARAQLIAATGLTQIAFIEADEQGGLEHADGIVAFIAPNVLVINHYPDDPEYAEQLRQDLTTALPGITIHEIITPYDGSKIYDENFGSACGLYTNMLVTLQHIYLPQFNIPEDKIALDNMRQWSAKEIIPIRSDGICQMGGGVRCMSWQLRGENARRLLAWAKQQNGG